MGWVDVRYCFAMAILVIILLLLSFFLSSVKSLSDTFLGDSLIKLYETLQECHMPCEIVPLRVDFSKLAAVAMKTAKMLKNEKHKNDHSRLLAKQKLMKLNRNSIHIQWNEISPKNRNRLDKLCRSCHGNKKERGDLKQFWIPFIKL